MAAEVGGLPRSFPVFLSDAKSEREREREERESAQLCDQERLDQLHLHVKACHTTPVYIAKLKRIDGAYKVILGGDKHVHFGGVFASLH